MFQKIHLLLIDDDPQFAFWEARRIPGVREWVSKEHQRTRIPTVRDDSPNGNLPELGQYFEVKWLQSPQDIHQFRNLSLDLLHRDGPARLVEVGFVPEIVYFDFALSEHMTTEFLTVEDDQPLLEHVIPNFRLAKHHGVIPDRLRPRDDKSKLEPPATGARNIMDSMGCYGGGLVVSMFNRQHPVAAIPTTRKRKQDLENTEAAFFTWLLEHEFRYVFNEMGRPAPAWYEMVPQAVKILRNQIADLALGNQIRLSLTQLLAYAAGDVPRDEVRRVLTFKSAFGERNLPLNGLFLDIPRGEQRDAEIQGCAQRLLEKLFGQIKNQRPTLEDFQAAQTFADDLWEAYCAHDLFLRRVRLSQLTARKGNLNNLETEELRDLEMEFQVYGEEAQMAVEMRTCPKMEKSKQEIAKRWAALFNMVRVWKLYRERRKNRHRDESTAFLDDAPGKLDFLLVLFPLPKNVVLPMHNPDKNANSAWDAELKRNAGGLQITSLLDGSDSLPLADKKLLQFYAQGIGLDLERDAPEWLK